MKGKFLWLKISLDKIASLCLVEKVLSAKKNALFELFLQRADSVDNLLPMGTANAQRILAFERKNIGKKR